MAHAHAHMHTRACTCAGTCICTHPAPPPPRCRPHSPPRSRPPPRHHPCRPTHCPPRCCLLRRSVPPAPQQRHHRHHCCHRQLPRARCASCLRQHSRGQCAGGSGIEPVQVDLPRQRLCSVRAREGSWAARGVQATHQLHTAPPQAWSQGYLHAHQLQGAVQWRPAPLRKCARTRAPTGAPKTQGFNNDHNIVSL